MDFHRKNVWVTGAGQGIGLAIAMGFHTQRARVFGLDRSWAQSKYPFETAVLDISDPIAVDRVSTQRLLEYATVDVLVNAAGIMRQGPSSMLTDADWQACFDTNVSGAFYLLRRLGASFRQQRSGAIVNIASNAAHVPRLGMAAYCASKAALVSLSHCVALELAPYGVRCNVVSPGTTDTPMLRGMGLDAAGIARTVAGVPEQFRLGIPLGKAATAEDIANTVMYLASDEAGHVTMQDIVVDGGATLGA
jgi:2,3-dihydro-2,3-dihydroxybenzoate dehydrogenase